MKIAVFDIGTNSIHMKIVQIYPDFSFEVLDHKKDMTRIGDGSFKAKKLSKSAVRRALKVLSSYVASAKQEGVRKMIAVATSAVRDAKNGNEFVKRIYKKTGLKIRVISGREEGRLIFLGASSGLEMPKGKVLIIDIGGGSAEFILGDKRKIDYDESFPLGVARLKDRFITKDPPSKDNLKNLEEYVDEKLGDVVAGIKNKKYTTIVGTGGTMINLASAVYEAREKRRLRLRGYYEIKRSDFLKLHKKISRLSVKRLRKLSGIDKKRADIISAGSVFVYRLVRTFEKGPFLVSDKGIREGLILDYIIKTRMKLKNPKPSLKVQWFGQKPFFSGKIL